MEPLISVRNLTKIYKTSKTRYRALNNVSLDVYPGEFLAILGTSGSGKSTLLSIIAGLEPPTQGKVLVMNHPIHRMTENELVAFRLRHVGFIFQAFNLFDVLTAQENAAFPLIARGVREKERMQQAKALLTELGLEDHLLHKPGELSGGQQQRVSIARALITNPPILFADEPTGNLDSVTSQQIVELLRRKVDESGTTLLFVTHDMAKAEYADRVIHLADGQITSIEEKHRNRGKIHA